MVAMHLSLTLGRKPQQGVDATDTLRGDIRDSNLVRTFRSGNDGRFSQPRCKPAGLPQPRGLAQKIALFMGPRIGELFGLKWTDWSEDELRIERQIREEAGKLEVSNPKCGSARILQLPPSLIAALDQRKKTAMKEGNPGCEWIFPSLQGTVQRKSNFYRRHWKPLLTKAEVRYRRFHQTRHTAIVHALAVESIQGVAQMAGHSTPETTLREYSSFLSEHRSGVASAVENMLQGITYHDGTMTEAQ